ncbi:MAG: Holliday junction resolvase RecU [Bacilli bacterium]
MLYPGNAKKTYTKPITYSNRGMDLESIINDTNKYYIDNSIAFIYKKPTPIGLVKVNDKRIESAYFKEASTLDYVGLYKGYYIEFDAKVTKNITSFPLNNIKPHQLKHIEIINNNKGIVFLIIEMNSNYYCLMGSTLLDFIKNNTVKSIPFSFIKDNAYELKYNYVKGLNYLKYIDIYLGGTNEKNEKNEEVK